MARRKKITGSEAVETQAPVAQRPIEEVIAENERLRSTIEKMSTAPEGDSTTKRYLDEIKKINQKGRVDTDKIKVVEFADHKNISLWTAEGKRIGPLHRDNALATFKRFFDLGIILSADQPTPEQIAAYKETDEYKALAAKRQAIRKLKERSRRSGQMERLAAEIAKMAGTTVDAINSIFKAHKIKSLDEGREVAGLNKG